MNFLTKLLQWSALSLFLAFGAKASPVCHEKADVYELALADMQGTGTVGVKPGTRGDHGALR